MIKKTSKILFTLTVFILIVAGFVRAERLPVKIYTSADGFGSSASFNLVRDARGFIWLCSRDGLVRFDGYRFITYRIEMGDADPAVLNLTPTRKGVYWINLNRGTDYRFVPPSDDAPVESIQQSAATNDYRIPLKAEPAIDLKTLNFEDNDGNFWTSNFNDVSLMRETDGKMFFEPVELKLPGNPTNIISGQGFDNARDGGVWIGTDAGLVRRLPSGKMIRFSINPQNGSDPVSYFAEDKQKRVWIARPEGLVVLKVGEISENSVSEAFTVRKAVVKNGIVGADGAAQLPARDGEAFSFSFEDILLRDVEKESGAGNSLEPVFYRMICASDGSMWLTSTRGLVVFDGKRFQHYTTEHGLASNLVSQIVEDNEGYIWIASHGGLHRINPKGLITFDETNNVEKATIHSIYENRDGELQIVSGNFNISSLRGNNFKMARPGLPKGDLAMWQSNAAYLDSRGDWWVNTHKNLYRFTGVKRVEDLDDRQPSEVYNSSNGLISDSSIRVFEDSTGNIWISTNNNGDRFGLTRWQRSTGKFQQFFKEDGLPDATSAVAFAEDKTGSLWFGFIEPGGITRYRDGRFTVLDEPEAPKHSITHIYRDDSGRIWIATNREGLFRVDNPEAEHPTFKRYTIAEGLTSNNIRCITEDLYGNIYVGTVRGINRLSPETGRVKYFGTSDGLATDFVNTTYRDRHGMIWFGTFNGLSKLIPELDNPLPAPTVLISGLRIAGEDYSVSPLGQQKVSVPEQSSDRNNLQIDFLSISTGADASVSYQYKFEGIDSDWSPPTAERSVTLANLSAGEYSFLVRAVNTDGVVSQQPAVASFTILPPVWQRWWFLTLMALAVSVLLYTVYRYRIAQIIKLEQVRTRIATDLHDDIGSSLSKIAILSEVVRKKTGANGANEPLEIIADTSREMIDSMSDIVWAINPEHDHLNDLIQRMRRFSEDILDARDIGCQFVVPENLKNVTFGADVRRDIYLIFKECVNNLAKYSRATEAEIKVNLENDNLSVEIKDNGRGFVLSEPPAAKKNGGFGGNGLRNMQRRAKNFGGDLQIDSAVGKGTKIVLLVPVGKKFFIR